MPKSKTPKYVTRNMMRSLQTQPKLQLLRLLGRIAGGQDLEAKVACSRWRAGRLVLGNLAEGHVGKDPEICRVRFRNCSLSATTSEPLPVQQRKMFLRQRPGVWPQPAAGTCGIATASSQNRNLGYSKPATIQSSQSSSDPSACTLYTSSHTTAMSTMILDERSKLAGNIPSAHQQAQRKHHIPEPLEQLEPLPPNKPSRLGDCSEAVWHIGELQSSGWREISRKLASDPERKWISAPVHVSSRASSRRRLLIQCNHIVLLLLHL